jgi:hypothetical protein
VSDVVRLKQIANEIAAEGHAGWGNEITDIANHIAELEAENRIFRSTESVDDSVWDALLEQVRVLQVKLDRVRWLPEKWREDEDACAAWEHWRNGADCANELESALGDEE